jgi:GDP-mannose 4,6-dehydratase
MKTVSCVTGVAGFVGSHLAAYLLEKGETVIGTFRWNEDLSRIESLPIWLQPSFRDKLVMVPMDLLDLPSCIRCVEEHRPDYIYHLAAQSYVPDSYIYPVQTIMTNMIGTLNLLEAVRMVTERERNLPDRVITLPYYNPIIGVCSSSEVYGRVEENEIPIKETQPFRPQNPYGVGKAGADLLGYMYWRCYGLKVIRTRFFTHTGPGRTMASFESSVAHQIALIEKGLQEPVVKVGYLDSVRTIADVRDAVRAYYLMMRKCRPGEVYNIGGNRVMRVGEVVEYLISLSTVKGIVVEVDPKLLRPADVPLQVVDTSKFVKETGWKPEIPFERTMADLLSFWREKVNV